MPVSPHYRPDPRYHALDAELYDPVTPAAFPEHRLRFRNQAWAGRVGLDTLTDAEWCRHFAGFQPLPDNLATPLALRYHGHQFRTYNPELGDGRGFLFAQLRDVADGRLLDLGTKGSGRTPWSRGADGRLTLKGGVREVLASEMLEAMGCYTSRSLSLIETGESLVRQDEPSPARSSVLVRLSHSHVRIGTFQRLALRGERDVMKRLVDYVIEQYWPSAAADPDPVAGLLSCVVRAVAQMGAEWWVAGFVHGVVNSDNVVLTGESFDYGPWRFLPRLDPGFTAAYFDDAGLYAFGRQPGALLWNLEQLARSLAPVSRGPELQRRTGAFQTEFDRAVIARTFARLGLQAPGDAGRARALVGSFYDAMQTSGIAFQRPFFDLVGGAGEQRLQASPASGTYASDAWRPVIDGLRECEPLPACTTLRTEPYWQGDGPLEMLVDHVEPVWQSIVETDDWTPFRQAVDALRAMGRAHRALGYSPDTLRQGP
ncbi:YdiU family protein [Aquisalimonas lutea]|uniref:protein adenylyltransferase SelO family protein n=1 Tax=Aquisalimonas lutea TaxID=1327750 RepID=UPI0025B32651|nr:YdiU family protein [Aquisalimonas lutea]MDN3517365.1 YdiU family protein [Aquisalimonas lutea]